MKNYSKMSDFEVNKAVASSLGVRVVSYAHGADGRSVGVKHSETHYEWFDYCNIPSDAWPIIEEIFNELVSVGRFDDGIGFGERDMTVWLAQMAINKCGKMRAAMIVYLMMKDEEK